MTKAEVNGMLVKLVIEFVNKEFKDVTLKQVGDSLTQFQDLISAASQAISLDEFMLYIAYKAAKARQNDLWRDFGGTLNKFIKDEIADTGTSEQEKVANLQQAMGYLMWAAYAAARGVLQHV